MPRNQDTETFKVGRGEQASRRDWVDVTSKLLLPAVLAIGGTLFTWQKDIADKRQQDIDRQNEQSRQQLDRNTGIIKLLASENSQEKDLGLKIITVLEQEHKFSPDLIPIVAAVAGGRAQRSIHPDSSRNSDESRHPGPDSGRKN